MRDLFAHTAAHWGRYSEYVWRTASDGIDYLLPTQRATPSVYDPMEDPDTLVIDALEIGMMQFRKARKSELKAAIKSFTEKYGRLGIMTALPTTAEFIDYEKVYLPKNPFLKQETMEAKAYIRMFFPFIQPNFRKKGVESVWQTSDKYEIAFAMTFQQEPQAMAMSFMRNYGERYDWLCALFKDWTFHVLTTKFYMDDKDSSAPETLALYRQGIAAFEGVAPTYHIELRDRPTLVWDFHSLLSDIRFLLSVMLTDMNNPLKLCKHCQKPFIAERPDAEYCSKECKEKHK